MKTALKSHPIGSILKDARGKKRSLEEASAAIGISKSHLWEIEQNRSSPSFAIVAKLCALYDADITSPAAHATEATVFDKLKARAKAIADRRSQLDADLAALIEDTAALDDHPEQDGEQYDGPCACAICRSAP